MVPSGGEVRSSFVETSTLLLTKLRRATPQILDGQSLVLPLNDVWRGRRDLREEEVCTPLHSLHTTAHCKHICNRQVRAVYSVTIAHLFTGEGWLEGTLWLLGWFVVGGAKGEEASSTGVCTKAK